MWAEYFPYFVLILLAVVIAGFFTLGAVLLGPRKRSAIKDEPFETGLDYVPSSKSIQVKFYQVAIVFLMFDVEVALLYPLVPIASAWGKTAFLTALPFLTLLIFGIVYEWKAKLLDF